jgi:hypothetical protein
MISSSDIQTIISDRGLREKPEYRVTYLVQMAKFYLERCLKKKIEVPEIAVKNEFECAKYDLEGWSKYLALKSKTDREKIHKLINYREVELRVPKKKLEIYPIHILYDVYKMERELDRGFEIMDFNLTSILLEPHIANRLNLDLEKEYTLTEIKMTMGRDIIRKVLQRIESKYIGIFAVLSTVETFGEEPLEFEPSETLGGGTGLPEVTKPENLRGNKWKIKNLKKFYGV